MPVAPELSVDVEIRPYQPGDGAAFRALNEEWIARYFTIEDADREVLETPEAHILRPGGHIYMAWNGPKPIGCCALIPFRQGVFELAKMAVAPEFRNRGIGRKLLVHAIEQARALGAHSLFLATNDQLVNAIHLYEALGFRHLRPEEIPPYPYKRATVFMELDL